MTTKLLVFLSIVSSILLSTTATSHADWAFEDEVAGKVVETYVSDAKLEKTVWKDEDEHPPLAARKAIKLAKDEVKRLSPQLDLKQSKLVFEKLCLEPNGPTEQSWVWVIEFRRIQGVAIDFGETVHIVVLMNGEVVKPSKIRDAEKSKIRDAEKSKIRDAEKSKIRDAEKSKIRDAEK
jgi:hypothetical protein